MDHDPPPSELSAWIAPRYMDEFQAGTLHASYLYDHPFPHCVLPDFLQPDVYERLRQDCEAEETSEFDNAGEPMYQGFVRVPDILRLLYGSPLRKFLNDLTGLSLARPRDGNIEATALAQVRHYMRGGKGLRIHNDAEVGFDVAMLYYLTKQWQPGLGGETSLYRQVGRLMLEEKVVQPFGNTLVLFLLSGNSFHCVQKMHGEWKRSNLFLGWQSNRKPPADPPGDGVMAGHVTQHQGDQ